MMRFLAAIILLTATGISAQTEAALPHWRDLFNGADLTGWDTYIAAPYTDNPVEKAKLKPYGLNNDPKHVFTVVTLDSEKVVRISGEIFAGINTTQSFQNYHLQLQFKWGNLKWAPKKKAKMDSGLLYHANGPNGVDAGAWMQSQEFQIQEGDCGDYWGCAGAIFDVPTKKINDSTYLYDPIAPLRTFQDKTPTGRHATKFPDAENPTGQWNTLDLYCFGDTAVHVVNGIVTMILYHSKHLVNGSLQPLTSGKIQLQCEGAEVFYRKIRITPITQIPATILKL